MQQETICLVFQPKSKNMSGYTRIMGAIGRAFISIAWWLMISRIPPERSGETLVVCPVGVPSGVGYASYIQHHTQARDSVHACDYHTMKHTHTHIIKIHRFASFCLAIKICLGREHP